MSPVRALPAELDAVRALLADGLAQITRSTDDLEQFWIRSACARLTETDAVLAEAATGGAGLISLLVTTAVSFGVVAGVAALARLAGAGAAGVLVASGVLLVTTLRLLPALRSVLARRSVAAAARHVVPTVPMRSFGLAQYGFAEVPEPLVRARVQLVSATLRQAGSANWPLPALRLAVPADPVLARLAHADLLLCQAIDCLERYLDDLAKE
ncbi:hypothetical protein [Actinoplanes awajinensis]|uniref:Uncharacterized protein n=1 Tax=Actinoplanes awajinensis subsp. mycoplanecinus TaxID=135947 RepID=A0A101J7Q7_9ACTN|nr:hypothetical protein [Actinoplanes awajinensis]KUL21769.1 hypothetical protein ADL15_49980 [Actinoplanes awajinensis subsp. mycoplanecinus]